LIFLGYLAVKILFGRGRMTGLRSFTMSVKLILRGKEYEVKPGMTLLDSLKKIDILPEGVIATCGGEMILEDEILKDGSVVKLIAVISGGSR
jgi:sulfur carrier protein ThiS